MRPYGLPRNKRLETGYASYRALTEYGLKSSAGRSDGKSNQRSSKNKRTTRRIWKRSARRQNKMACVID